MLTFIAAIALLMILKCFVDKPEESTWPSAVVWTGAGLWLVITSPEVFSVKLGVGIVCLLRGIAHLGDLTLLPWLESRGNKQEAEEEAGSTESVPPSVATPTVTPYAVPEESPISAEEPEEHAPMSTPVAQSAPEENDEEENNSPTPPAAKPLAGKRVCVTGKLPYKRRRVEDFIVALGGTISGSVTRNTDFLIYDSKYDNRIYESTKYAKACELGVLILSWKSFMAICGFPEDYDIFESESCGFWNAREQRRESVEIKRAYGKEYERMSGLLKKILCGDFLGRVSCEIRKDLIKPISVVVKCDDADQEDIEVLRVCRYEVSPSTNPRFDGDFLFFDKNGNECDFKSLTVDSVARLLAAYGR